MGDRDTTPLAGPLGVDPHEPTHAGRHGYLSRGDHLARFVVLNRLGVGGMGIVYVAHDPLLNRQVALKVLRAGASGTARATEARARLLREAQAMARLSHPNVITVHEVGTVDDEIFLVMELNDGSTLRQWLDGAPRPWQEVVDVFAEAGRGLAAAHRAGLTHRDFKPDNVLLSRDGRVRVVDFGLVHVPAAGEAPVAPPDGDVPLSLTHTGAVLGTPTYMAPEQHRAEPADPRTDQFSFCVALHEGLYGRRPFLGDTYAELVSNVLDGVISPPAFNRGVPPAVYQVLLRGLGNDRETRYLAMDALLDDLLAFAELDDRRRSPGAPARARSASQPGPTRRRSPVVLVASVLLVAAVALGIAALVLRGEPERGPTTPEQPGSIEAKTAQPQTETGQTPQTTPQTTGGQATFARTGTGDAGSSPETPEQPDEASVASGETEPATRTRSGTRSRGRAVNGRREAEPRGSTDATSTGEQSPTESAAERRRRELELSPL